MKKTWSVSLNLYKYACRLNNVKRFGSLELERPVSVAEHSFRVALLAMNIVDDYNLKNPDKKVNAEEVLRKCLIHDVEEAVMGDIPSPIKNLDPEFKMAYKNLSIKVMKDIVLPGSSLPEEYLRLWIEDKSGETGEVVMLADMLEAFCTACYELKRGNVVLAKAYNGYVKIFEEEKTMNLLKKYPLALTAYLENKAMVNPVPGKLEEDFEVA